MVTLHVNIDHVATLRQARGTRYPDPVWAAAIVELAGADGITIHVREDRRHMQERDLLILRQTVQRTLNLEMAATEEMVAMALDTRPDIVTLVPEKREERTTEGGLDVIEPVSRDKLARACVSLGDAGIPVSLFVDPSTDVIEACKEIGAPRIELHTGDYCEAQGMARAHELQRLADCARLAHGLGMHVAAGHGLDYDNVAAVAALEGVEELNIGHSIVSRAVLVGMERAVKEMIARVRGWSSV